MIGQSTKKFKIHVKAKKGQNIQEILKNQLKTTSTLKTSTIISSSSYSAPQSLKNTPLSTSSILIPTATINLIEYAGTPTNYNEEAKQDYDDLNSKKRLNLLNGERGGGLTQQEDIVSQSGEIHDKNNTLYIMNTIN